MSVHFSVYNLVPLLSLLPDFNRGKFFPCAHTYSLSLGVLHLPPMFFLIRPQTPFFGVNESSSMVLFSLSTSLTNFL